MKPINTARDITQINDSTAGQQRVGTLFQLEMKKYGIYAAASVPIYIFVMCLFWYLLSSFQVFNELKLYLDALFTYDSAPKTWKILSQGTTVWYPNLVSGYAIDQPKLTAAQVTTKLWDDGFAPFLLMLSSLASCIPAYLAFAKVRDYFISKGDTRPEVVRGGQLINEEEYKRNVEATSGFSPFTFGGLHYPKNNEFLGTMIVGAAGSGKSNEYRPAMERAFLAGAKCIIFDPTGEDTERYFRPGIDILFAPANQLIRTKTGQIIEPVGWSLMTEVISVTDTQLIANAFIPVNDKQKSDFFLTGAQQVFSAVVSEMRKLGHTSTKDLSDMLSNIDKREELKELLANSPANRVLGKEGSGQSDGVFGSISNYLGALPLVHDGNFSVRNFIQDQETSARLFICAKDAREIMMPLYRVVLTLALNELSLMPPANGAVRCAFFIDELPALGYLEKLSPALQEMRKYGVMIMAVCQSLSQIRSIYGEDAGRNLYGAFQNIAVYRIPVKAEQEELSGILGEQEVLERNSNFSLAVQNDRDGVTQVASVQQKAIVHFSEMHLLKIGQAYIRFAGFNPLLLDNALFGISKKVEGNILFGATSKPFKKFLIKDSDDALRAEGTSDEKGNFEIELNGEHVEMTKLVVIVPPVFESHNDGLKLRMNPRLHIQMTPVNPPTVDNREPKEPVIELEEGEEKTESTEKEEDQIKDNKQTSEFSLGGFFD